MERDRDAISAYTQRAVFLLREHKQQSVEDLPKDAQEELFDLSHQLWPALHEWRVILSDNQPDPDNLEEVDRFTREWIMRASPELRSAMSSITAGQRVAEEIVRHS